MHRVGRTARAGASGTGVTFVADDQTHELVSMARDLGLHRALELGGFPSDATRGREQRRRRRRREPAAAGALRGQRAAPPADAR